MSEKTDYDAAILKAAEAVVDGWLIPRGRCADPVPAALIEAVHAKRAAERPRLLTVVEAHNIFGPTRDANMGDIYRKNEAALAAVLSAYLASVLAVLGAIPRVTDIQTKKKAGYDASYAIDTRGFVPWREIEAALLPPNELTKRD